MLRAIRQWLAAREAKRLARAREWVQYKNNLQWPPPPPLPRLHPDPRDYLRVHVHAVASEPLREGQMVALDLSGHEYGLESMPPRALQWQPTTDAELEGAIEDLLRPATDDDWSRWASRAALRPDPPEVRDAVQSIAAPHRCPTCGQEIKR